MIKVTKTILVTLVAVLAIVTSGVKSSLAQESVCANVRIEIQQELAFERQAFDARMRIINSLPSVPLTDVSISVWVKDDQGNVVEITSDPNNSTAKFFVRIDSLRNIGNVSGTGVVQAASDAEIHWLLIPTAGASGGSVQGKIYFVGATLSYKVSGELQEVEVTPDMISVKPQPELELDYFLTRDVRADDPMTQAIEPSEPFSLGVRIKNAGIGTARRVLIDSAQPRIIENEQGLLIGFRILGSSVQDEPTIPSLLINFGDIAGSEFRVGRWLMETSLAGEFISFSARFMHSDELGGNLTSLLTDVRTHFLIRDVLVDLPGRDAIRDFLALDESTINLYESDGTDTLVTNYSDVATFTYVSESDGVQTYRFTMPVFSGSAYASLADPFNGSKEIVDVVRSDSKVILEENAWFAVTGVGNNSHYYVRLFDVNGGGEYLFKVREKSIENQPPLIQHIADKTGNEGAELSFVVSATDPNGTLPSLLIDSKPSGSRFTDNGDGTALFEWTPTQGQKGQYTLTFRASDGELTTVKSANVRIFMAGDSDGDNMLDSWEMFFFGHLSRDGTGDLDGDGVSDLAEFERDSDPTFAGDIPSVPVIQSPLNGTSIASTIPTLVVNNSNHGLKPATYDFELYSDSGLTTIVASKFNVSEGQNTTAWTLTQSLSDNTNYYWRARAKTSFAISEWVHGAFFVNTANDPPTSFTIDSPEEGEVVSSLTPILSVSNSSDPDGDVITYGFEVRLGSITGPLVASISGVAEHSSGITAWQISQALMEDTLYFWRATATDSFELATHTSWSNFVPSLTNNAPSAPIPQSPEAGASVPSTSVPLIAIPSVDPENETLEYYFEIDTTNTFNSSNLMTAGPISESGGEVRFTPTDLAEDTVYFWRIRSRDSLSSSPWSVGTFRVNVINQAPSVPSVINPGMGASVSVLTPALQLTTSSDPDGEIVRYQFEVYKDGSLLDLVTSKTTSSPSWILESSLVDNTRYYWRARAIDPQNKASAWIGVYNFFVNNNSLNDPPVFSFIAPGAVSVLPGSLVSIRWSDADPDSNALISILANGQVIASGLQEDPDDGSDTFVWNTSGFAPGVYQLTANIADEQSTVSVQGSTVTILNTDPVVKDSDGDLVPDESDNCPYFTNSDQRDVGGLVIKKKDGIGNACQCGDVTGDGIVNKKDPELIKKALKKGSKTKMKRPDLCDVGSSKGCTLKDVSIIEKAIKKMEAYTKLKKKKGTPPKLPQVCAPANP